MKISPVLVTLAIVLLSCNSSTDSNKAESPKEENKKPSFFPVTSYLKGELYNMEKSGINPLKYTTIKNHTDSVWLKLEEVNNAVKEFLQPEIDSVNLVNLNSDNPFVAWSLVVFYRLDTDPPRNLALFDGLDSVSNGIPATATLSGFLVPNAGFDAKLGVLAYEGDSTLTGSPIASPSCFASS